jgi:hypothetical protein
MGWSDKEKHAVVEISGFLSEIFRFYLIESLDAYRIPAAV